MGQTSLLMFNPTNLIGAQRSRFQSKNQIKSNQMKWLYGSTRWISFIVEKSGTSPERNYGHSISFSSLAVVL